MGKCKKPAEGVKRKGILCTVGSVMRLQCFACPRISNSLWSESQGWAGVLCFGVTQINKCMLGTKEEKVFS